MAKNVYKRTKCVKNLFLGEKSTPCKYKILKQVLLKGTFIGGKVILEKKEIIKVRYDDYNDLIIGYDSEIKEVKSWDSSNEIEVKQWLQLIKCKNCNITSVRKFTTRSDMTISNDIGEIKLSEIDEEIIPCPTDSMRSIQDIELPFIVLRDYKRIVYAFNNKKFIDCVNNLGSLLEAICTDKKIAKGKYKGKIDNRLSGKINGLAEKIHAINGRDKQLLHLFRQLWNTIKHSDKKKLNKHPLSLNVKMENLIDLLEYLLMKIYVEDFRQENYYSSKYDTLINELNDFLKK